MNEKLSIEIKTYVKNLIGHPYLITQEIIENANFEEKELTPNEKLYIALLS